MESNITRDHIALEAMKVIMEKTITKDLSLIGRIWKFFTGYIRSTTMNQYSPEKVAEIAYVFADAMIAQREAE